MTEIPVTTPVTLVLEPAVLNVVLAALEGMPYRAAAPVIRAIHQQVIEQVRNDARAESQ